MDNKYVVVLEVLVRSHGVFTARTMRRASDVESYKESNANYEGLHFSIYRQVSRSMSLHSHCLILVDSTEGWDEYESLYFDDDLMPISDAKGE